MISFTCGHCGKRVSREDVDATMVEWVDLDNGTGDQPFPLLGPDEERHIDQRLCCLKCYERAGKVPVALGQPHPYDPKTHQARLARVQDAFNASKE